MRHFLAVLAAFAVVGLAFWAYSESNKTRDAQKQLRQVQNAISEAQDRLEILRAEWAYQNRPERLQDLINLNFERVPLVEVTPDKFVSLDMIPIMQPAMFDFDRLIEVSNPQVTKAAP